MANTGLPQNMGDDGTRCPVCGAIYQDHYTTCLVDGAILEPRVVDSPAPPTLSTHAVFVGVLALSTLLGLAVAVTQRQERVDEGLLPTIAAEAQIAVPTGSMVETEPTILADAPGDRHVEPHEETEPYVDTGLPTVVHPPVPTAGPRPPLPPPHTDHTLPPAAPADDEGQSYRADEIKNPFD